MAFKQQPIYWITFEGDKVRGRNFVGLGQRHMDKLKRKMSFRKLSIAKSPYKVDDDTFIVAKITNNYHEIEIWCRPHVVDPVIVEEVEDCLCSCCFSEAYIVSIGGTEVTGDTVFTGDYAWGDPRLRYDVMVCYKKEPEIYTYYLLRNVRPSDYTQYAVGDQCLVAITTDESLVKCTTCDNCGDAPESIDTLCDKVDVDIIDIDDVVILPINITDHFTNVNYTPLIEITKDEFALLCISTCSIQDLKYPVGGTNTYNTANLLTYDGIYGAFDAEVVYNGHTGQVSMNQMPACAFRIDDDVMVIHTPMIVGDTVTYLHNVICHTKTSLPTREINGTTRPVPFDDVLYMMLNGYTSIIGDASAFILDAIRGNEVTLRHPDTYEIVPQPISFGVSFSDWPSQWWSNRPRLYTSITDENHGRVHSYYSFSEFISFDFGHVSMNMGHYYIRYWDGASIDECGSEGTRLHGPVGNADGSGLAGFYYVCGENDIDDLSTATYLPLNECDSGGSETYSVFGHDSYGITERLCSKITDFSYVLDGSDNIIETSTTNVIYSCNYYSSLGQIPLYTKNHSDQISVYGLSESYSENITWSYTPYYEQVFRNKYIVPPVGSEPEWNVAIRFNHGWDWQIDNAFFVGFEAMRWEYCNIYGCFDTTFKVLFDVLNYEAPLFRLDDVGHYGHVPTQSYDAVPGNFYDDFIKLVELGELESGSYVLTPTLSNIGSMIEIFIENNLELKSKERRSEILNGSAAASTIEFLVSCEGETRITAILY